MECASRRVGTQMIGVHRAVHIVEDVVDAELKPVCQRPACLAQIVSGIDAPYLIAFAVAVVLIVAFAAASRRQADAKLGPRGERVVEQGRGTPLMVRRAVDDYCGHSAKLLIIQVGFRVEVAVCGVEGQVSYHPIRQRDVYTAGTGIVHVLVHSGLHLAARHPGMRW